MNIDAGTADRQTWSKRQRLRAWFLRWLCGVGAANETETQQADEWERKLSNLNQNPLAQKALYALLVVVLCFGIVLYCFWSLWTYGYPNGGSNDVGYCESNDGDFDTDGLTSSMPTITTSN